MIWFTGIVAAIAALVAIAWIVGMFLPARHTVSRQAKLPVDQELLWQRINEQMNAPAWRGTEIRLETVESRAPEKLVRCIADSRLPFGGTWTYEIRPFGDGGSIISITEDGVIKPPLFRVMSLLMSKTATIDAFLKELAQE